MQKMASYDPACSAPPSAATSTNRTPGNRRESARAVDDDARVDLGADGERRWGATGLEEAEEGAVPASIVEQAAACKGTREREPRTEAAAVTPGDERIAAVDLLPGVMAGFNRISDCQSSRLVGGLSTDGRSRPFEHHRQIAKRLLATPLAAHVLASRSRLRSRRVRARGDGQEARRPWRARPGVASARRSPRSWTAIPPTAVATTGVSQASASSVE